jgi:putative transcriptional regulator
MLNENIKAVRRSKGLSQEELAIKLNVVRQTVSKWERGLSVPDSEMLISISEVLETPVSVFLDEKIEVGEPNELKMMAEKLEIINLQFARQKEARRKIVHWLFILLGIVTAIIFVIIGISGSPYLNWNFSDPETAVAGTLWHAFEWVFIRIAPIVIIGAVVGAVMTRTRR